MNENVENKGVAVFDASFPKSAVVGLLFFAIGIVLFVGVWHIFTMGSVLRVYAGEVISVVHYSARGSIVSKALVELEDGRKLKIVCRSCRRGETIDIVESKSAISGKHLFSEKTR